MKHRWLLLVFALTFLNTFGAQAEFIKKWLPNFGGWG